MPLDSLVIRKNRGGNPDVVRLNEILRQSDKAKVVDKVVILDDEIIKLKVDIDQRKKQVAQIQKEFSKTNRPGSDVKQKLKEEKAIILQREKDLKVITLEYHDLFSQLGNTVDMHSANEIVDSLSLPKEVTCSSKKYIVHESFEKLNNQWIPEKELPQFVQNGNDLFIVCAGSQKFSNHFCKEYIQQLMLHLKPLGKELKVEIVASKDLKREWAFAFEVKSRGELVAVVANCTDYEARQLNIRSGHKKMLQVRKKFVHTIYIHLQNVNGTDPLPLSRLSEDPCQFQAHDLSGKEWLPKKPHEDVFSEHNLATLELWLANNSFIKGPVFSSKDEDYQKMIPHDLPFVQYPSIARWLSYSKFSS